MPIWIPDWLLPGAGIVIVNIRIWVFAWGRRTGGVNHRLKTLEGLQENPTILPECTEIFTVIRGGLSNLDGKVSTLLLSYQENQKNSEKKHLRKKEGKKG